MSGDGREGSIAPYATTYDPNSVYVLSPSSGEASYSLSASQAYNKVHYVWHGPEASENYAVLYNIPGHSGLIGAPASQAEKIVAKYAGLRQ
jgi:hypothetical protein